MMSPIGDEFLIFLAWVIFTVGCWCWFQVTEDAENKTDSIVDTVVGVAGLFGALSCFYLLIRLSLNFY